MSFKDGSRVVLQLALLRLQPFTVHQLPLAAALPPAFQPSPASRPPHCPTLEMTEDPTLEVRMSRQFLKLTTRPCESAGGSSGGGGERAGGQRRGEQAVGTHDMMQHDKPHTPPSPHP